MVVIRLQRRGTKKVPHHRIVVADRRRAQSGRTLEILEYYDPSHDPAVFKIDESRLAYWVSCGAQVNEAVAHLLKNRARISLPSK